MKLILSRVASWQCIVSSCLSILRFLKPIDGIPVPNGQLLSLVPSAAIRGMNQEVAMLGNKMKSIEYSSCGVTFEVTELPLVREHVYVKLSIVSCIITP